MQNENLFIARKRTHSFLKRDERAYHQAHHNFIIREALNCVVEAKNLQIGGANDKVNKLSKKP
jgi:hypothetical protein